MKVFRAFLRFHTCETQLFFLILNVSLIFSSFYLIISHLLLSLDRMPPQIGDFISAAVYNGKLLSNPSHPITSEIIACYLIDVSHGQEQRQSGESSYQVSFYD